MAVVAFVALAAAAYLATVQFFSEQRQVAAAPSTVTSERPANTAPPACPGGFTEPQVGTATRSAPLAAIRAYMGWTERFVVDEMRTWRGSDGLRRWYVKAEQENTRSRRGRWLVWEDENGQRQVLASAPFATRGYAPKDWRVTEGLQPPTGVAGCLAGS
jgi:hypothetical protein